MWMPWFDLVLTLAALLSQVGTAVPSIPAPGADAPPAPWHTDYGSALEAARKSHKPVLLFQLLGSLDDAHC